MCQWDLYCFVRCGNMHLYGMWICKCVYIHLDIYMDGSMHIWLISLSVYLCIFTCHKQWHKDVQSITYPAAYKIQNLISTYIQCIAVLASHTSPSACHRTSCSTTATFHPPDDNNSLPPQLSHPGSIWDRCIYENAGSGRPSADKPHRFQSVHADLDNGHFWTRVQQTRD